MEIEPEENQNVVYSCEACTRYLDLRQRQIWLRRCAERKIPEKEMVRRYAAHALREMQDATPPPPSPRDSAPPVEPHIRQPPDDVLTQANSFVKMVAVPYFCNQLKQTSPRSCGKMSTRSVIKDKILADLVRDWFKITLPEATSGGGGVRVRTDAGSEKKVTLVEEATGSLQGRANVRRRDTPMPKLDDISGRDKRQGRKKELTGMEMCKLGAPNETLESTSGDGHVTYPIGNGDNLIIPDLNVNAAHENQELNKRGDSTGMGALDYDLPVDVIGTLDEFLPVSNQLGGQLGVDSSVVPAPEPRDSNVTQACGFFETVHDEKEKKMCNDCKNQKKVNALKKRCKIDKIAAAAKENKEKENALRNKEVSFKKDNVVEDIPSGESVSSDGEQPSSSNKSLPEKSSATSRSKIHGKQSKEPPTEATTKRKRSPSRKDTAKKRKASIKSECQKRRRSASEEDATGAEDSGAKKTATPRKKEKDAKKVETKEERDEKERKARAREKIRRRKPTPIPGARRVCNAGVRERRGFDLFLLAMVAKLTPSFTAEQVEQYSEQVWGKLAEREKQAFVTAAEKADTGVAVKVKKQPRH